jgi:hypothetical protein
MGQRASSLQVVTLIAPVDRSRVSVYVKTQRDSVYAMRTIFSKPMVRAACVAMALAVSGTLWALSFGQAFAGFCPAVGCGVVLPSSNSGGTDTFGDINFAMSLNVATIDFSFASGNRIGKIDFPGGPGLADNPGGKLTMATLKTLNPQDLSSLLSNGTAITDLRQLVQQFTARGETRPAYSFTVARVPEPASLILLASGLFLALGLLRWKRVI